MAQTAEYMLISGAGDEVNKKLADGSKAGWKPILQSCVLEGMRTRSHVILERAISTEN